MRYSANEFAGISSLFKIDLKLFAIISIIVFLGLITLLVSQEGIARS